MKHKSNIHQRKTDHLDLADQSAIPQFRMDARFYYEPMLDACDAVSLETDFMGYAMKYPVWVSSMTGGTSEARSINLRLAELCAEFGLGMGLGSCRVLLNGEDRLDDFAMRAIIGPDRPLMANIGIAQVEQLSSLGELNRLDELVQKLDADGLIIHVNPLQEWAQDEGDLLHRRPIDLILACLDELDAPLIVKEVGQGMGPGSLRVLLDSSVAAIEFGAAGGTNFTRLELLRSTPDMQYKDHLSAVGHTIHEMLQWTNAYLDETGGAKPLILSGGINNYLDGYHAIASSHMPAIYGMAGAWLPYARESYTALRTYFGQQVEGLLMAKTYLRVRSMHT